MKYKIKFLPTLLFFAFSFSSFALHGQDIIFSMPMLRALQSAEFEPIMPYMNDRLEINLPDEDSNIVSKKQAKAILTDYFKKNKMIFAGFQNKTEQKKLQTLTYISKTINKTFTTFVVLKNNKIIKIKISVEYEVP